MGLILLLVVLMIVGLFIVMGIVCYGGMMFGFVDFVYRIYKMVMFRKLIKRVEMVL